MNLLQDFNKKFDDLREIIINKDKDYVKLNAHGGFSIIFAYPPEQEEKYIRKIREDYPEASFINVSDLFIKYIDDIGYDDFITAYEDYSTEPEKLFKTASGVDDLFELILKEIEKAGENNKMPVLIRTGALYGTGIENINIMDDKRVHALPIPLIIMYPAQKKSDGKIYYLNFKPASEYRAIVI